ncbi:MAG: FtsH protease activity modulator HflK [Methylophaga sp.]|nr:FtsH protease activity modulator HflK [Methylophaga sp.]
MAWNEPGNDEKDPWGKRGNDGPPDLDDVVRNLQNKLGGLFGGKNSGGDNSSGEGRSLGLGLIAAVILVVWLFSGIYIIEPAEEGVVLQFGKYSETTTSGPHWHIPFPVEKVEIVDVQQIRNAEIGYRSIGGRAGSNIHSESLMLTKDENIVDLKIAVQYRIKDASMYLFNVRNADLTLRQMTESAIRETVGKSDMDFVLTEGRSAIVADTEALLQGMLDKLETGLEITSVNMQDVQPPEQVQAAFADAVKAREDKVRQQNEAEAYANDVVPRARGGAFRLVQEAEAYKSQIMAKAEGETSRFLQVMAEYEKAPKITKERLYLDTMESVYSQSQKVLVDVSKDSNNVLYLPLDRMRGSATLSPSRIDLSNMTAYPSTGTSSQSSMSSNLDVRSRGGR